MKRKVTGKDLAKEAPRSPRIRVGGYAILARTIDKCRALVAGDIGEYHFDCPLDNMLFGFKGVKGEDFKAQIEHGASDQEMVEWLNRSGEKKTPEEIKRWAKRWRQAVLYNHPEKREFFREAGQKTRARSGEDHNLRVARNRRQSLSRAASGVEEEAIADCRKMWERRDLFQLLSGR